MTDEVRKKLVDFLRGINLSCGLDSTVREDALDLLLSIEGANERMPVTAYGIRFTPVELDELNGLGKIFAIKKVRSERGVSLRDAKYAVDELERLGLFVRGRKGWNVVGGRYELPTN